jgi:hypothetical protein
VQQGRPHQVSVTVAGPAERAHYVQAMALVAAVHAFKQGHLF